MVCSPNVYDIHIVSQSGQGVGPVVRPRGSWVTTCAIEIGVNHRVKIPANDSRQRDIEEREDRGKKFGALILLVRAVQVNELKGDGVGGKMKHLQTTLRIG